MTTIAIETAAVTSTEVFIPLNKLKKHPNNARKTPHSEASIEAKAASIHAKGILQNLVVEPELDAEGAATGFYLVSIGEGRRLAQLLRVNRKQIKKTEPKAGSGLRSTSTTLMATACAAPIRIRWPCRRKTRPPMPPHRANMTR